METRKWQELLESGNQKSEILEDQRFETDSKFLRRMAKVVCEEGKENLRESVRKSNRHSWVLNLIPEFDSWRPSFLCGRQSKSGVAMRRWVLGESNVEMETGRFQRKKPHLRFCNRCHGKLGTEEHVMSFQCPRARRKKKEVFDFIFDKILMNFIAMEDEPKDINDQLKYLHEMEKVDYKACMRKIGELMSVIEEEILGEKRRRTSTRTVRAR